ncbi:MAG: DNA topoisomerase I [Candidatus Aenigmatarchaeota archaeon]|nr:MAG: DNA topoisomerase I [Candidatus Aenigmarchaeota archaeon]
MATLVIAEKPKAAEKIAAALGTPKASKKGKAVFYEVQHDGDTIYVVPSVGHIFSLKQKGKGWTYPIFDIEWLPSFEVSKSSKFTKAYYDNLAKIAKKCSDFVIATDFDTEGSVIGYNILRFICETDDARRMKFSTLTTDELREAYESAGPLDTPQIEAGLARHVLDWLWGINASRALTKAINSGGKGFTLMSTGRVQGPSLKLLADREREIRAFKSEPYWDIEADVDGPLTVFCEEEHIPEKERTIEIKDACGKTATVESLDKKEYKQAPPTPFDLTSLQMDAYAAFGFSPSATLSLAQSLYTEGLISYPRTSSQKLPAKLGLERILKALAEQKAYAAHVCSLPTPLQPNEGPKSDAAHPAIHPTGEKPAALTADQKKLYDMVVHRFIATFAKPATRETVRLVLDINGIAFSASGNRTVDPQWREIYKFSKHKEVILPALTKGQELNVLDVRVLDKETQPPKRYTEASLVHELEKRSLGTKATRSEIIRTLYERSYVKDRSIVVTELGLGVIGTLEKYVPEILSEEMTRSFEQEMESIMENRSTKEKVIEGAKKELTTLLVKFKDHEKDIGAELGPLLAETRKRAYTVGPCQKCGGELKIVTAKASRKRFVGCTGYPKCESGYPLPQYGLIKTGGVKCKTCGLPTVLIIRKGKRPWNMCIDPKCTSKTEWGKSKDAAQTP